MRFKLFIISFLAVLSSLAQDVALKAPSQAVQDSRFQVSVVLTNVQGSAPKAPEIENCTLIYGPATSTMQSTEIINGQYSTKMTFTFTYTYRADKASTVTIPAITVNTSNNQKLSTKAQSLTILPPDKNAQQHSPQGAPAAREPQGTAKFNPDDMFVRISLNKSSVYEQEPVIATVKVYTRTDISMFRVITQPTFEGFLSEELSTPNSTQIEHVNGKNYTTMVLKRCILYPQRSGTLTINSGKYEVTLVGMEYVSMGYFPVAQRVEKKVNTESNTAKVTVLPLPAGAPASFNGAVGHFDASVALSPLTLRTNESASYKYIIKGTGNIKYLKTPDLNLPPGIDQYTPQTEIDADFNGSNISGTYTVTYTLVPQEPGKYDIEPQHFSYFDPSTKDYKTIDLPGFKMYVAQGASTTVNTEQKAIAKGMTDIRHIRPSTSSLSKEPRFVVHTTGYWLLYAALAGALAAVILVYRRNLRLKADVKGRKLAGASKAATKRLKAARAAMARHEADKFYAEINKALFGYLSDKLGIPASQLVRDNIAQELATYGVDQTQTDGIISILDDCEMARFTPQHSDSEMSDLYNRAMQAIKGIENVKPSKRK